MTIEEATERGYIRLLGHWEPASTTGLRALMGAKRKLSREAISDALRRIVGPTITSEVREPSYGRYGQSESWHQDCGGTPHWIIVWSSCHPTLVRAKDTHEEIEGIQAGDVVEIANRLCEHCTPPEANRSGERWFARLIASREF